MVDKIYVKTRSFGDSIRLAEIELHKTPTIKSIRISKSDSKKYKPIRGKKVTDVLSSFGLVNDNGKIRRDKRLSRERVKEMENRSDKIVKYLKKKYSRHII